MIPRLIETFNIYTDYYRLTNTYQLKDSEPPYHATQFVPAERFALSVKLQIRKLVTDYIFGNA